MKKLLFIFFLLIEGLYCYGQNAALNHSKYWFYKYRLRNEFMAVGDAKLNECGNPPIGMNIPATSAYEDQGDIHFGDGTSFLGNYMAVLATEYQLLKNRGSLTAVDKENIKRELYWCLKTYERLDKQAEKLYSPYLGNCTDRDLNGFFARDDVSNALIPYLGNPKSTELIPGTQIRRDKKISTSYYNDAHFAPIENLDNIDDNNKLFYHVDGITPDADYKDPFPSADQISNLLVGFAFVKKIMNEENYNGENFGNLAVKYTSLIMNYFSSTGHNKRNYPGGYWDLNIPYNGIVAKHGGIEFTVMAYPLAKAGEVISIGNWGNVFPTYFWQWSGTAPDFSIDTWNCSNYPAGFFQYQKRFKVNKKNEVGNIYTNAILSQLAAISNSWEYGLIPIRRQLFCVNLPCMGFVKSCNPVYICTKLTGCMSFRVCLPKLSVWDCDQKLCAYTWSYNAQLPTCLEGVFSSALHQIIGPFTQLASVPWPLPKIAVNTTGIALSAYGTSTRTELFSLEHRYLHGGKQQYEINAMKYYMNTAPCSGPHFNPKFDPHNLDTSKGHPDWRVENRFEKSNPVGYTNKGGWNGIDYMLLHNLYYLQHGSDADMTNYRNEMNYQANGSLPTGVYNGFETLTASAAVVPFYNTVTFHAGKCVKMNGGFKAAYGSNFKAYTNYVFPCNANIGYNGVPQPVTPTFTVDSTRDSTQVKNQIIADLQQAKDSLEPVVQELQQRQRYQPLSEFVQTPVQAPPILKNKIIAVFPNPISDPQEFAVDVFLVNPGTISIFIVDMMGNVKTIKVIYDIPSGETIFKIKDINPRINPGLYKLVFQGSGFSLNYSIQIL